MAVLPLVSLLPVTGPTSPVAVAAAGLLGTVADERLAAVGYVVTKLAVGYTRGQGFDLTGTACSEDIFTVIAMATARMDRLEAARGLASKEVGDIRIEYDRAQWGWSLAERLVLDRYRVRVASGDGPVTAPPAPGGY